VDGTGGVADRRGESTAMPSSVWISIPGAVAGGGGDKRRDVRARFVRGEGRVVSTSSSSRSLAFPFFCALVSAKGTLRVSNAACEGTEDETFGCSSGAETDASDG
jgi:hypothetical protein